MTMVVLIVARGDEGGEGPDADVAGGVAARDPSAARGDARDGRVVLMAVIHPGVRARVERGADDHRLAVGVREHAEGGVGAEEDAAAARRRGRARERLARRRGGGRGGHRSAA